MNLRKIIREEMDDFDWATGYQEIQFKVGDKIVVKNVGSKDDYIQWLGGYGRDYRRGKYGKEIIGTVIADYSHTEGSFFELEEENTMDQISFPYKNSVLIRNYPNLKLEYYLIEDEKNINESEGDLDWIRDITPVQPITDIKWEVILRHPRTDSGWVGADDPGPDNKATKLYGWYLNSWKKSFSDWSKYNYDIKIRNIMGYIKPSIENRACPRVGLDIFGEKNNQNYSVFIRNLGNCGYTYSVYYSPLTEKGKVVKQEEIIRTNEGYIQITKGGKTLPEEILSILRDN